MGLGEHGDVLPLVGEGFEAAEQLLCQGEEHLLQSLLNRKRCGGVVDVLRGESEVDELLEGSQSSDGVELLLDEVLHSLDIVVGDALDILHALGILLREVLVDGAQSGEMFFGECCELRQWQFAEEDEIFDFDPHAVADECEFRKELVECFGL